MRKWRDSTAGKPTDSIDTTPKFCNVRKPLVRLHDGCAEWVSSNLLFLAGALPKAPRHDGSSDRFRERLRQSTVK